MFTKRFIANVLALTIMVIIAGGCSRCYRVTDVGGHVYYTHDTDCTSCGMLRFKDLATGEKVTVQYSHVEKVSNCDCKEIERCRPCPRTSPCPRTNPCGYAM